MNMEWWGKVLKEVHYETLEGIRGNTGYLSTREVALMYRMTVEEIQNRDELKKEANS